MAFAFNTKKHGSINDNALRDLPLGKHNYVITKITYAAIKADQSGKRKHLIIELRHSDGGSYTQFLEITPKDKTENEATRARIAAEEFNAYVQAAGFKGNLTAPKFKLLYEKPVGIETVKTVNKATKKEYINVNQIIADGFSDDEVSSFDPPSDDEAPDDESYEDEGEEEEDDDEAEAAAEAERKKKAAAAKRRKAAAAKKKAAEEAAAAEAEDEDEDSDEEDAGFDEDEDDDDPFS